MRIFLCLAIMFFMAHFDVRIGFMGIFLAFAFFIAFLQDCREFVAKK